MEAALAFTPPHPLNTAVLFLLFNRLDTTRLVFEAIRQAKPPRLYVAADGPRPDRAGEFEKVQAVRSYVLNNIDWPCEVKTLFRDRNLGCGVAVSSALDWFFALEEAGIILEDDVLPDPSFFPFCEELLERYRAEPRIVSIAGNYFAGAGHRPASSYYFSRYPHISAWATWRRIWQRHDQTMATWPQLKRTRFLTEVAGGDRFFVSYWSRIFDMVHAGRADIWDYQFTFSCWASHALAIVPACNLVRHIGFGAGATHTTDGSDWAAHLPLERMEFPLIHPDHLVRHTEADRWTHRHAYGVSFKTALNAWIFEQPGGRALAKGFRSTKDRLARKKQTSATP